jgi:hypothetical protein
MAEGAEELGVDIRPTGIICCAHTALDAKNNGTENYVGIDNIAFTAEPINPRQVEEALKNPQRHLEEKMEGYVVVNINEFRDMVDRNELRMPDMAPIGREFYKTSPGQKLPLTHIRMSGII